MKNIVLATGLLFSVTATTLPIYEQEREVLYAMHTVGQDFAGVSFVKDNVDMFISVFKIHADLLEAKLAVANQKAKKALWTVGGVLVGTFSGSALLACGCHDFRDQLSYSRKYGLSLSVAASCISGLGTVCATAIRLHFGLDCYNAFKERNALKEALALDQEILEELITVKELAMFSVGADVAEDATDGSDAKILEAAELE
jgi:hypothetical protein